jgi:hypothetical protein
MANSPSPAYVQRKLKEAEKRAQEHTRKYGTPVTARVIRASNGEVVIVYDMKHTDGRVITLATLEQ